MPQSSSLGGVILQRPAKAIILASWAFITVGATSSCAIKEEPPLPLRTQEFIIEVELPKFPDCAPSTGTRGLPTGYPGEGAAEVVANAGVYPNALIQAPKRRPRSRLAPTQPRAMQDMTDDEVMVPAGSSGHGGLGKPNADSFTPPDIRRAEATEILAVAEAMFNAQYVHARSSCKNSVFPKIKAEIAQSAVEIITSTHPIPSIPSNCHDRTSQNQPALCLRIDEMFRPSHFQQIPVTVQKLAAAIAIVGAAQRVGIIEDTKQTHSDQ